MPDLSSTKPVSRRANLFRLLLVSLSIPLAAATFAPRPAVQTLSASPKRSELLHSVSRMFEDAPGWTLVTRYENPTSETWTIIAWYDCPVRPTQFDPDELLILEKPANTNVLIATTRNEASGPCDPLRLEHLLDPLFLHELRREFSYRSVVLGRADLDGGIPIVTALIEDRVRELEEPPVALTSVID